MSAQHTTGPWGVFEDIGGALAVHARALAIANVVECDEQPGEVFEFGPVSMANARLIAAAPELLEAAEANSGILQALLVHLQGAISDKVCADIRERISATDAAIAKATGSAA